jgi:catechol 2,3-dioxygenase-like lactoylglutathione lyase family enzyme
MASWANGVHAITLFVDDVAAARDFYRDVLGLPIAFADGESAAFNFGNTILNVLRVEAAPELIQPVAVAPRDAGSRSLLTIDVADVDAVCAELSGRGVSILNGPVDRPWGVRTAAFADPAGHVWEIAAAASSA